MKFNIAKRASASMFFKENVHDKPFSCLCAIVVGEKTQEDFLGLSINLNFLNRAKNGDQEILLSRFIDKGLRSILASMTNKEIVVNLNIFQASDIDLYAYCFKVVAYTLKQIFPIQIGFGSISKENEFNLRVIGTQKEICTIDFVGNFIPKEEVSKHIHTCLKQCEKFIEELDKIPTKQDFPLLQKFSQTIFTNSSIKCEENFENFRQNMSNFLYNSPRSDGRAYLDIRPINIEVDLLDKCPSAIFSRGDTSVLAILNKRKSDIDHSLLCNYSFPAFCVGEIGKKGNKTRREIGHGFFINQAFAFLKLGQSFFANAEVLSSNGSSSLASICAISTALKNAGLVHITIGGISFGAFKSFQSEYNIVTDISGIEDKFSEMDFKIAGRIDGVSAILMDSKQPIPIHVIDQILKKELEPCLTKVIEAIEKSCTNWRSFKIDKTKVGLFIGQNGSHIRLVKYFVGRDLHSDSIGNISAKDINFKLFEKILEFFNKKTFRKGEIIYFINRQEKIEDKSTDSIDLQSTPIMYTIQTPQGDLLSQIKPTNGFLIKAKIIKWSERTIEILEQIS